MLQLLNRVFGRDRPETTQERILAFEDLPSHEAASRYVAEYRLLNAQLPQLKRVRALREQIVAVEKRLRKLRRILAAFEAGFEPTTPNSDWFCGVYDVETEDDWEGTFKWARHETFPHAEWTTRTKRHTVAEFKGLVPAEVIPKIRTAQQIFGAHRLRVYAPDEDLFVRRRLVHDPIMIGLIKDGETPLYFEVARWDTEKDLQAILAQQRPAVAPESFESPNPTA